MFVIGVGTAVPPRRYTQRECWEALTASTRFPTLTRRSQAILRKVLSGENGIASRYLALDPLTDVFEMTPDALHGHFTRHASALASQAAAAALSQAGVLAASVDALLISTCTGYLCPGLTSYVSEQLKLRPDALVLDLVGQGCGAALPNLRTAEALVASGRCKVVVSVCVEICSAAFYLDDDPGVLVSACLFGDGAAAAVLSSKEKSGCRRVCWKAAETILSAKDRDQLRFERRDGLLRNFLGRTVPELAAGHSEIVLNNLLETCGVSRSEITGWIFHAGGRDVLGALRARLALTDEDLRWTASILREYGNLSSASVLFVLQEALRGGAQGGYWWMASFGAGFSCHGALVEVD